MYKRQAKALRRGALWEPEAWVAAAERPNAAAMVKDHAAIDVPAEIIEEALARDLDETLWRPGGEPT